MRPGIPSEQLPQKTEQTAGNSNPRNQCGEWSKHGLLGSPQPITGGGTVWRASWRRRHLQQSWKEWACWDDRSGSLDWGSGREQKYEGTELGSFFWGTWLLFLWAYKSFLYVRVFTFIYTVYFLLFDHFTFIYYAFCIKI